MSNRRARIAAIAFACAGIAIPAGAGAAIKLAQPPQAEVATTGNDSELIETVPIGRSPSSSPRVVMSLGPDELERIEVGDRLRASAEMQVSTTCLAPGPRCVGRPYEVNPKITAQIVLAGSRDPAAPSLALSSTTRQLCKQQRPNRNHHCTLAIPNAETAISDLGALPCPRTACYVNLVVTASSKHAKPGNVVVVGADEPDGSVKQDKGRLNVVQTHAAVPAPTTTSSATIVNAGLPLTEGSDEKRRVVYSVPIPAPQKGEALAFDASFQANISELQFNTFVATRVILGDTPTSTDSKGIARPVIPLRGAATESNGFNCTLGGSGYSNPCTSVKAGATRISRSAVDPNTGLPATVYLNVVASAKPLNEDRTVKASRQVAISPAGQGLVVTRWGP
jgi:hypothetical protein